jgi:hypothetical protein
MILDASTPSYAQDACGRVDAPADIPASWARAVNALRDQLVQLSPGDCRPVTLVLELGGAEPRLVATTADGRRAERKVTRPESVVPVGLGLVMTIPPEESTAVVRATTSPPAPTSPGLQSAVPQSQGPISAAPEGAFPPSPGPAIPGALWVGVAGGLRLTAPTNISAFELEARGDLLLRQWLLTLSLRSALTSCTGQEGIDCDVYNDASIGVGAGRRLRLGSLALDLVLEPSFVVMHMEFDGPSEGQNVQGSLVALRADASGRLAIPFGPSWALTLTIDGGVTPSVLASPSRLPLPSAAAASSPQPAPFPAWSGGLRLGLSGKIL